jgi:Protein of unknown function (DUF3017)
VRHERRRQPGHPGPDGPPRPPAGTRQEPRGGQLLYWIVACGAALALVWLRGGERYARSGTLVLAGVLLAAAVARLVLPERRIGMLGSRGRLADVAALGALGAGLLITGLVFPAPP